MQRLPVSDPGDPNGIPAGHAGLGSAVAVALVSVASGGLVVLPWLPPLDPALGLAVPLALLFGAAAAPGVAAGTLLGAAIRSSLSWLTALDALAAFVLAYAAYRLWGVLPSVATGADPRLRSVAGWIEFGGVTAVAATTATAVLAWGALVAWGGFFHAIVLRELSIAILSTLAVGPAVIYPVGRYLGDRARSYPDRVPLETGSGGFRGAVLVPLVWIVVGSLVSLALGLAQLIGVQTFVSHGFRDLVVLFDPAVVGDGGRRLLVVFGALMLSLLAATYAPPVPDARPERQDGTPRPEES